MTLLHIRVDTMILNRPFHFDWFEKLLVGKFLLFGTWRYLVIPCLRAICRHCDDDDDTFSWWWWWWWLPQVIVDVIIIDIVTFPACCSSYWYSAWCPLPIWVGEHPYDYYLPGILPAPLMIVYCYSRPCVYSLMMIPLLMVVVPGPLLFIPLIPLMIHFDITRGGNFNYYVYLITLLLLIPRVLLLLFPVLPFTLCVVDPLLLLMMMILIEILQSDDVTVLFDWRRFMIHFIDDIIMCVWWNDDDLF